MNRLGQRTLFLRESDDEYRPVALDRLGRYAASMSLDYRSGDGQAQSRLATLLTRFIAAIKAIEDVKHIFIRLHPHHHSAILRCHQPELRLSLCYGKNLFVNIGAGQFGGTDSQPVIACMLLVDLENRFR